MRWAKAVAPFLVAMSRLSTAVADVTPTAGALATLPNPPITISGFRIKLPVTTPLDVPSSFFTLLEIRCSAFHGKSHAASSIRFQKCLQDYCDADWGFVLQSAMRFGQAP